VKVRFHPLVLRDVGKILDRLADEFNEEVLLTISQAAANPLRFHLADRGFRRAN
jgi:hypothetical protein